MGADVRLLLVVLLLALAAQGAARVHTVLLTPSTPSPSWIVAEAVNFTLAAGRPAARVVQSSQDAPCTPLVRGGGFARALDVGTPFFLWHPGAEAGVDEAEVWFYIDGECDEGQSGKERRLARRKDLDWAQLWGIVLGIAFGLVALAAFACCSWCCCFQHRVRAHQARLHVRDEGVQTGAAHNTELPLYERRVRDGEVQLEEAPAPDYHLATRSAAVDVPREPVEVPLPPSPTVARHPETQMPMSLRDPSSAGARHPPTSPRDPRMARGGAGPTPRGGAGPPPPPDDLPPAYSHAPP